MRIVALSLLALAGCGHDAITGLGDLGAGGDLASPDLATAVDGAVAALDLAAAVDLGGFCGDPNSARIDLNGMLANSPSVSASPIILNCCDAAEIDFVSMQIATPISIGWRHQVGQGPNPPVVLDLANLPSGWSVSVRSGCVASQPNCTPTDSYTSGITGTLTIDGNPGAWKMTACASVVEPQGNPHPVIHTLDLWTPTVTAQ